MIAGTALSTTWLAVVYAVLVETGLNATGSASCHESACFVTDLGDGGGAVGDLHHAERLVPALPRRLDRLIVLLPRIAPWFFARYGDRVIEPEIKLVFACLFVLMVLADAPRATRSCRRSCSGS